MHDGSLATLEAVVDHYSEHVVDREQRMRRVHLSADDKRDLIAFLRTLDATTLSTNIAQTTGE